MREKLRTALNLLTGKGQFSVHKRILRYVLFGTLLPLLTLTVVSLYGLYNLQRVLHERGTELGESAASYAADYAYDQTMLQMRDMVLGKVQRVEIELSNINQTTQNLAAQMTYIMQHPGEFPPRMLMHPRFTTVYSGQPFLFYCRNIEEKLTEPIRQEMMLASNWADTLNAAGVAYSRYIDMCYAGSKNGYVIRMEVLPGDRQSLFFSGDFLRSYDPRTRLWYNIAKDASVPLFTEIYRGSRGQACITCAMPYYDGQGFAGVIGLDANLVAVTKEIDKNYVGENGFNFAINNKGQVIFSSRNEGTLSVQDEGTDVRALVHSMNSEWFMDNANGETAENTKEVHDKTGLVKAINSMIDGESGFVPVLVDGEEYYLAFSPLKTVGWSFGTAVSKKDLLGPADSARQDMLSEISHFNTMLTVMFILIFLGAVAAIAAALYILYYVSNRVAARFVKPIHLLADGVRDIAGGQLDKKLTINTGDELEHLANSFNAMTEELAAYTQNMTQATAERERIATELHVAKEIQVGILPRRFPQEQQFSLYATMRTAKEVGGDFYDFYRLDHNHLMLTIADVSGKGIGAALFMTASKTILQNFSLTALGVDDVAEVVQRTNDRLCRDNDAMMFVTVFTGLLNLATGEFVFVNCGHNPPLLYRQATGRYEYMTVNKNFVLGAMDELSFKQQKITLAVGDRLFLYTDGVTEALNPQKELYSETRLLDTLNAAGLAGKSDRDVTTAVQESIDAYADGAEQFDDITMLSFTYKSAESGDEN